MKQDWGIEGTLFHNWLINDKYPYKILVLKKKLENPESLAELF